MARPHPKERKRQLFQMETITMMSQKEVNRKCGKGPEFNKYEKFV